MVERKEKEEEEEEDGIFVIRPLGIFYLCVEICFILNRNNF
jgi:hypothetical protein